MRGRWVVVVAMVAGIGVAVSGADKKIQAKDLPAAVQKAVEEETKGATIKGFSKETEHGKTFYEAETVVNGRTRDVLFDKTGKVVEVEEELPMDAVPAPVKAALEKRGKIVRVESVTKGQAPVTYEAHIEKNGKKSAVALDATGKVIKP